MLLCACKIREIDQIKPKEKVRHLIHPAFRLDFTTGLSAFLLRCLSIKSNQINKGDADAKGGGCSAGSHVPSLHLYALHSFGLLRLQERGYATKVAVRAMWVSTALGSIAQETQCLSGWILMLIAIQR